MALFTLRAVLDLVTSKFDAGLKRSESAAKGFVRNVSGEFKSLVAGAFTIGAVSAFTKSVIGAADRIGDMAEQFSLTTDEVQKLEILAGKTGVKFEQMAGALLKLSEMRQKAGEGDKQSQMNFAKFGVSLGDINNQQKTNLDLLVQVSEGYDRTSKSASDQAELLDLVGVKGAKVAAVIKGINDLGGIKLISKEDIDALGQAEDAINELKRQMTIAAAPALGFWGRVVKRGNELDSQGNMFALTKAIWQEMRDEGPSSTGALTPEDIKAAREKMNGPLFTDKTKAKAPKDISAKIYEAEAKAYGQINSSLAGLRFQSSNNDSMAKSGGFFFGADALAAQDIGRQMLEANKVIEKEITELNAEVKKLAEEVTKG